jgi:hypothetical protein
MVAVVAGCIVLVLVIGTMICWQRQSLNKPAAAAPVYANPNMSMTSYPSGTFPVASNYASPNVSILSGGPPLQGDETRV